MMFVGNNLSKAKTRLKVTNTWTHIKIRFNVSSSTILLLVQYILV